MKAELVRRPRRQLRTALMKHSGMIQKCEQGALPRLRVTRKFLRLGGKGPAVPLPLELDRYLAAFFVPCQLKGGCWALGSGTRKDQPGALTKFLHAVDWSHVEAVFAWGSPALQQAFE